MAEMRQTGKAASILAAAYAIKAVGVESPSSHVGLWTEASASSMDRLRNVGSFVAILDQNMTQFYSNAHIFEENHVDRETGCWTFHYAHIRCVLEPIFLAFAL
jgi:hypothetical protein